MNYVKWMYVMMVAMVVINLISVYGFNDSNSAIFSWVMLILFFIGSMFFINARYFLAKISRFN
ncbi:hypothetical protein [Shouchella patagoniensis]|uniref:hypothetical protein n=1 Tax=Shouchella patagoniensis TaxID=228576 RepID=UPI000994E6FF|nr:hypothetical protein [Shouchella patagoniensis]